MSLAHAFRRKAIDPLHSGEALKDYVTPTKIDLDYVPGLTQMGYLYELLTNEFGMRWLNGGTISAKLMAPLYNGEQVLVDGRVVSESDGGEAELEVWIEKEDGTRVTVATARCPSS